MLGGKRGIGSWKERGPDEEDHKRAAFVGNNTVFSMAMSNKVATILWRSVIGQEGQGGERPRILIIERIVQTFMKSVQIMTGIVLESDSEPGIKFSRN